MAQEEKEYAVVKEAVEMVEKLKERYPDELWPVIPREITVLGVTNKDRPKMMRKLATIRIIRGSMKAILQENQIGLKHVIELYYSDWNAWSNARRQWVIFHELLHIAGPDERGLIKHDVEDFSPLIAYHGIPNWWELDTLPDMLDAEKISFDKNLFVKLHLQDGEPDN